MATEKNNPQTGPFLGVIFGASGDLAKRKLMPAIFSLSKDGLLSPSFAILGMSRREGSRPSICPPPFRERERDRGASRVRER